MHDNTQHETVQSVFRSAGRRSYIDIVIGSGLEDAVRQAVMGRAQVIGVAGGDGTISSAANELVQTQAAMLPIPVGTRNHSPCAMASPTSLPRRLAEIAQRAFEEVESPSHLGPSIANPGHQRAVRPYLLRFR